MSQEIHSIIKELRPQLEGLYGPRLMRMVLYGSQARGDAEPGSDIDVLVEWSNKGVGSHILAWHHY
jgi:predicted nucleotidyltransferase